MFEDTKEVIGSRNSTNDI